MVGTHWKELVLVMIVMVIIGIMVGSKLTLQICKMCQWNFGIKAPNDEEKAEPAQMRDDRVRHQMAHIIPVHHGLNKTKAVQSMVTYTRKQNTPRFKPLPEWEQGAWEFAY